MGDCERAYIELKHFLASPSIFVCLKENQPLTLYLVVSEKAISSILVQDIEADENSVHFVGKILIGAQTLYQKIKRLVMAVVFTIRKL